MNSIYIVRAQKAAKYTLIAAVLIVPFHLAFISKDTFQFDRKDRIISKKLNWLQNNISTVQPKKCYTESVGVNTLVCFYLLVFQTWEEDIYFHKL